MTSNLIDRFIKLFFTKNWSTAEKSKEFTDNTQNAIQQEKLLKLKKMKFAATSLLAFMALIYIIFRRIASYNIIFSSIAAFSEAAIIGALADWFAVVALFRHPLGMPWIPHTAIIQKNKDKIGESISNFVVSNFFTADAIKSKLDGLNFTDNIIMYFKSNSELISKKTAEHSPDIIRAIFSYDKLNESIYADLKNSLKNFELSPLVEDILQAVVSSRMHVPVIKQLLTSIYKGLVENKEKTIRIIEGMNLTFTLPMVSELTYKFIIKTLSKQIEDMESGAPSDFNRELLYKLPDRLVNNFRTSKVQRGKVEKFKADILDSEMFDKFLQNKVSDIKAMVLSYTQNSGDELGNKTYTILNDLVDDLIKDSSIIKNIDELLKSAIVYVICAYRHEIANLISGTVKDWPVEDMVDKLEVQVGGDLQYIRINGTVIGGLAGLLMHILSLLF